jgi:CheY-like chemotaxis protein
VDRGEGEGRDEHRAERSEPRERELQHEPAEEELLAERARDADRGERQETRGARGRCDDPVELQGGTLRRCILRNPTPLSPNSRGVFFGDFSVIEHCVGSLGIKSQSAEDGPTAMELLRISRATGEPFDLVIMEFMLPGMDGQELAQTIRNNSEFSTLKLLLVTSVQKNGAEKLANDLNPEARFTPAALAKLMKYVHDTVPEFRSVSISTMPYDHRLLEALVQKRPAVFFPHRFFFVAPAAGELTTMTALAKLIRQTERKGSNAV